MAVEASDAGTQTPPEENLASEDELRQTSFDSDLHDTETPTSHQNESASPSTQRVLHKSISFGTGATAGGVASESLLKSLAHTSFDTTSPSHHHETTRTTHHGAHSTTTTTTTVTYGSGSGAKEGESFSKVPEELELHRRMSTSSQIADKFGDTEDIPRAIEEERRRSSFVEVVEERASPVEEPTAEELELMKTSKRLTTRVSSDDFRR